MRWSILEKYTSRRRSTVCSTVASRNSRRTVPPRSPTVPTRWAGTPSSWASAATAVARSGAHVTTARPCDAEPALRAVVRGAQQAGVRGGDQVVHQPALGSQVHSRWHPANEAVHHLPELRAAQLG